MQNDIFKQLEINYDIISEKEYEKETGKKLDKVDKNTQKKCKDTTNKKSEQIEQPKETLNKQDNTRRNGLGVLQTTSIRTSNTFLNIVQEKEEQERKEETQRVQNSNIEFPYKRVDLMTNAEKQLYYFMRNYLDKKDGIVIFPKVRLADIIDVDNKITLDKKPFYKISSKHVDFLICKYDTLEVICVVELDDYTHDSEENKQRDMFVMEALYNVGIQVFRIKIPIKTICKRDLELIDERINTVLAPPCPGCGAKMIPKKSMRAGNKGHRFYSCPNFMSETNKCRCTINIDEEGEKLP